METIKISVEVSVNLSETTQNFIKSLISGATLAPVAPAPAKPQDAVPAPTPAKSAEVPKPQAPAAAPAQTKPAAALAPGAPAAQDASSAPKGIEDVRKMLAQKVNAHREEIKQKLTELGAPSVTKLDSSKFDEMYNFLEAL